MDMHTSGSTFNDEGNANSNARSVEFIEQAIRSSLSRGQYVGLEALTSFRDIGESLTEAKEIFPKGEFGPWAEAKFNFSKEWRARLMRLGVQWSDVIQALEWATESQGRILGRKEYGVDGALSLAAEWRKAMNPASAEEDAAKAEAKASAKAEKDAANESETDTLRRLLHEALGRITELEALVKGGAKGKAKAAPEEDMFAEVPPADKAKARKIHGLYERGATEGERDAAKGRLEALATKNNMTFEAFMAACGLAV